MKKLRSVVFYLLLVKPLDCQNFLEVLQNLGYYWMNINLTRDEC